MNATAEPYTRRRTRALSAREAKGSANLPSSHADAMQSDTQVAAQPRGVRLTKREFPHLRQRYDWDCGLVCCQGFGIAARYHTITWGANESYKAIDYYKENLESDASRVNQLFERAAERGLLIKLGSVSMDEIIEAIASDTCVGILLVDTLKFEDGCAANVLPHSGKRKAKSVAQSAEDGEEADGTVRRMAHSLPGGRINKDRGFVGHYVVLVSYRAEDQTFQVSDPGVAAERRTIHRDALEAARKQHGTDEDLLVIDLSDAADAADSAPAEGGGSGKRRGV